MKSTVQFTLKWQLQSKKENNWSYFLFKTCPIIIVFTSIAIWKRLVIYNWIRSRVNLWFLLHTIWLTCFKEREWRNRTLVLNLDWWIYCLKIFFYAWSLKKWKLLIRISFRIVQFFWYSNQCWGASTFFHRLPLKKA